MTFKLFGREPTLWIAVISSTIMLLATFGFGWLDNDQAGLIVVAINAVAAAVNAWTVRPISPAVFTYASSSIIAAVAAYGLEVTPEQLAGINSLLVVVLALLTRGQVEPQETSVSRGSTIADAPNVNATGARTTDT